MADVLELLIKAAVQTDGGLDKINNAVREIGKNSGLSGQALSNLQSRVSSEFQKMTAAGLNFNQQIAAIAKTGNTLGLGVGTSAQQIQTSLNQAAQAAKNVQTQVNSTKQALSGIQGAATNPFGALTTSATNFAATLGPLGLAIGGVVTVATLGAKAMYDLVDSQGKAAQQTVNLAAQIGISSGEMKKLQVEGNLIGVSFQSMQIAARQLAVGLEEPTGAGKLAAKTLNDLGVATHTAAGEVKQEGAVFTDVIEKLSGIADQTKRTEEATRLFGSRSSAAILLLIGRYKELDATARSLGYGDTTQLQEALAKGEEKINAMSSAWDLFKAKLAQEISPIIIPLVTSLTSALSDSPNAPFLVNGKSVHMVNGKLAPISGPGLGDVKDFLGTYDRNQASKAAGQSYFDSLAGSPEAIQAQIAAKKKTLGEDESILSNPIGVDASKLTSTGAAAKQLRTEIDALEASLKRTRERTSEITKLREDAKFPDLQSPIEFRKLIAERQKSAALLGPGNDALLDASPQFGLEKTTESIRKFFLKIGEEARKDAEKTLKDAEAHGGPFALQNEAYKKQLRENVQISESDYSTSERKLKLVNDADRANTERQQQRAIRLAELSGVGGEGNAIALGTQARIGSATTLRNDQLGDIQKQLDALNAQSDKTLDDRKQINELTTQGLEVELNYNKEIATARMDAELKLLELRQKELDGYKKEADQIFDALRTPGSQGIRSFFNAQGTDLARTLFSNATAPVLQTFGRSVGGLVGGQTTTDANGNTTRTALGQLLQGTIFDSAKSGKSPQVIAIDANTLALNRLTGSLTGKSVGGAAAPTPDPNSITGVIAQEASGASPLAGAASSAASSTLTALTAAGATPNALSQFVTGASKGIGNWGMILSGQGLNQVDPVTGDTIPTYVSHSQQAGAAIGTGALLAGGAYEAYSSFSKGGVSGALGGVASVAGTAAMLDPDPVSKGVLAATATIAGLVKSIMPDPKAVREASIANQIAYNQYLAPATMNRNLSADGGFEQVNDKYGMPSATAYTSVTKSAPYKYLSPIQNPGSLYQTWLTQSGIVSEPYQAPPNIPTYENPTGHAMSGSTVILNIHAVDSESFMQAGPKIANSLHQQILQGHPVAASLQRAILGA